MKVDPQDPEVTMVTELTEVGDWTPELMSPGSVYVLENAGRQETEDDPYWAVLACPECGMLGLVRKKQIAGLFPVVCGSDTCPAHYFIDNTTVRPCKRM
ncbi:MAG TPA: hypothetical protein VMT99_02830 [Candidatus Paceibacterota bacterium]|nr:hypothetical protein [Candidatus Paceibacterota bacterium]